jgi:endonuclease YncB( thermonuclease family)
LSDRMKYSKAESEARNANCGLWHDPVPDPNPIPPWDYRKLKKPKS